MRIDFISDVTCPWCAIGLAALERAIERLGADADVELHVQPFELNPDLPPEGEAIADYAARKYGATAAQLAERQALIRERGDEVGIAFAQRARIWNTFDAHRLLLWADLAGRGLPLKRALLAAYHVRRENPGSHDVLLGAAAEAGLDVDRARAVLLENAFAAEVRERVRHWQSLRIHSVPSVIIDGRYLVQGGQPVAAFEQALRAAQARAA